MEDITVLKQSLPYIQRFKGTIFVVKLGGDAMVDAETLERLIEDITLLQIVGIRVMIVHGGGKAVTDTAAALGIETQFVAGRRVTDKGSLDVLKMVLAGKISLDILSLLKKKGVRAIGLSGVAAGVIEAKRRPPVKVEAAGDKIVDYGEVGDIQRIDTNVLRLLIDQGYIPVLSPLGADAEGNILNINADTVAARVAAELNAEKLLMMTGAPGVMHDLSDPTSLISKLTASEAKDLIKSGVISGGMIPKIEAAITALSRGCAQVHVLSAVEPHQVLLEVFTKAGSGTMIVP